jgi:hypothetical protein
MLGAWPASYGQRSSPLNPMTLIDRKQKVLG